MCYTSYTHLLHFIIYSSLYLSYSNATTIINTIPIAKPKANSAIIYSSYCCSYASNVQYQYPKGHFPLSYKLFFSRFQQQTFYISHTLNDIYNACQGNPYTVLSLDHLSDQLMYFLKQLKNTLTGERFRTSFKSILILLSKALNIT